MDPKATNVHIAGWGLLGEVCMRTYVTCPSSAAWWAPVLRVQGVHCVTGALANVMTSFASMSQAFPFFKPNFAKMEEYGNDMGVEEVCNHPLWSFTFLAYTSTAGRESCFTAYSGDCCTSA